MRSTLRSTLRSTPISLASCKPMASLSDLRQPPSSENSPPSCKIDETPQVEQQIETPLRKRGGYDCEFVERPKELETDCPICLQILRDPFQVSCCGHSFCQSCIKCVQADKKSCPTCNEADFSVFPDKRLRRSLYAFQVRCVHQKSGCEWIGELEVLAAVGTRNICKFTANKLSTQFWAQIQVSIEFTQLPSPLTATLLVHALHTKGVQRPL